eukprot:403352304
MLRRNTVIRSSHRRNSDCNSKIVYLIEIAFTTIFSFLAIQLFVQWDEMQKCQNPLNFWVLFTIVSYTFILRFLQIMRETRNTLIQLQLKAVLLLFIIPCFVLWTGLGFYWLLDEHDYYFQINKMQNSYKTQQSGYSYQDQQFSINNQQNGNGQYKQQQKNQNECLSKANQAIITFWLLMSMIVIFVYFIAIIGYVYELIKESGNAQVVEFNDYRQVNQRNRRRVGESDINGVGEHQQMIYLQASLRHVRNRMNGRLENGVNRVHIDSQNYLRQIDRYAFEAGLNSFERDEIPVYEYQSNQYVSEKQVNPKQFPI